MGTQKKERKSHIQVRLNILFSIIVIFIGILVVRLFQLQVQNTAYYQAVLDKNQAIQMKSEMVRGQMYDRNGELLVGNQSHRAIQYTRHTQDPHKMIEMAKLLATLLDVPIDQVSERDMKDYWAVLYQEELNNRLTITEQRLTGAELYEVQLSKIYPEELGFSDADKEVIAIFTRMNSVPTLETTTIKNREVSALETERITENLYQLPGVFIGSDWERTYPKGSFLRSLLGSVSTQTAGIPASQANQYLARGYASNARVGTSYLEQQYEDVLKGTPSISSVSLGPINQVDKIEEIYEGKSGANLVLTIDSKLQERVDAILNSYMVGGYYHTRGLNSGIYAVVQKVNSGEILAISGKKFEYNPETNRHNNVIEDDTLNVINGNFSMGSVVKAATVGIGYRHGIISEDNNTLIDQPLFFENINSISSSFNRDTVMELNDVMALARSSNIYMSRIAMSLGKQNDFKNFDRLDLANGTLDTMRREYAMFGLGAYTGIDVPIESRGYSPYTDNIAAPLYLSFGQFDAYTPLQVSQYMATVANGGIRYAPRLVKEVRHTNSVSETAILDVQVAPKIMNTVSMAQSQWDRIHEGLFQVTHHVNGTEYDNYSGYSPLVSGKTGTAEAIYNGPIQMEEKEGVINTVFSGFAPSNNPDIVVTVIIPNLSMSVWDEAKPTPGEVAKEIFNAYFYR